MNIPILNEKLPAPSSDSKTSMSVLEVSDPKVCILAHLMTPLEPLDPMLESPLSHPLIKQKTIASELLSEVKQQINNKINE